MQSGLLSTYRNNLQKRGLAAWVATLMLLVLYLLLYFTEIFAPVADSLHLQNKWMLYGLIYTIAIVAGGVYFLKRHGNSRYHRIRTVSLMIVQIVLAFSIPLALLLLGRKDFYFSYLWPLKIDYFYPSTILQFPLGFILYSFLVSLLLFPLLGFFLGKRFYCSWVCGCGGLAETAGEPFRHLSSKKAKAWRFEQFAIYAILLFALCTTAIVIVNWALGQNVDGETVARYPTFSKIAFGIQGVYAFLVVSILSGIVGVVAYPLMGSRVWCRFFCPMAALLGLIQKFGRFRITVKDDMCISCGNCSAYCEMGIDVRMYAQNNKTFKRAACVGCGICAHVCPRGVLKLENKWDWSPNESHSNQKTFDI